MNLAHRWLCNSNRWRDAVKQYIIPWTLEGVDLGANVLEVGPGFGATTTELAGRVGHLTCVEIHCGMADRLRRQSDPGKVTVLCEDATHSSLPADSFDGAVCFTMLHHIPSPALQDRLLAEVLRLLKPGGVFAGTDSKEGRWFRILHILDTLTVVDPATFAQRLAAAGFEDPQVDVNPYGFRFRGKKPGRKNHGSGSGNRA